jgi:SAM-dependent methyltransferase
MKVFDSLLEQPFIFKLSQLPFTKQKFARILKHNDIGAAKRILDIGCGPGTNAPHFKRAQDYLGIDINERYIQMASRRYRGNFLVADATTYEVAPCNAYDFVLINSFLHHVDTLSVQRVLSQANRLLSPGGHVHSIEVVLPEHHGLSHLLARWDRGNFPRPLDEWKTLFEQHFCTVVFEPFSVVHLGVAIMDMVYFKGHRN